MGIISVLSKQLANLIAAGEVVERPASVVKELCENSLDAGADTVTVEIKGGGAQYIRVTDNGCGMAPDDAQLAFSRHATSKLHSEEQLLGISTMGFRGEALAAISSVSKVDLITRKPETDEGTLVTVDGGEITETSEVGCPSGTTVVIRDLFFNTPARLKFLKKDATEASVIEDLVQQMAVARGDVSFELIKDGKTVLMTSGSSMKEAVREVFGSALASGMLETDYEFEGIRVKGFVGKPEVSRPSRKLQFFSVNGRVVRSVVFRRALEEAQKNSLMQGKYPICALDISVAFEGVDVNVHPSKLEIKFANERKMYDAVFFAVKETFFSDDSRPVFEFPKQKTFTRFDEAPASAVQTTIKEELDFSAWEYKNTEELAPREPEVHSQNGSLEKFAEMMAKLREKVPKEAPEEPVPQKEEKTFRLVGELFKTYVIAELEDEVLIIDKHAAKERMIFEKLKASKNEKFSQKLISPMSLYLSKEETAAVLGNLEFFDSLGFEIEDFGDGSLLLRGVPCDINAPDAEAMVTEAASKLLEGRRDATPDIYDELLHSMACKAALKGGQHNADGDLYSLVKQLLALPDIKHCPHGRPVAMTLTKSYFESRFKR